MEGNSLGVNGISFFIAHLAAELISVIGSSAGDSQVSGRMSRTGRVSPAAVSSLPHLPLIPDSAAGGCHPEGSCLFFPDILGGRITLNAQDIKSGALTVSDLPVRIADSAAVETVVFSTGEIVKRQNRGFHALAAAVLPLRFLRKPHLPAVFQPLAGCLHFKDCRAPPFDILGGGIGPDPQHVQDGGLAVDLVPR